MENNHPLWNSIIEKAKLGDTESLTSTHVPYPLLVLTGRMRGYIAKRVKLPLQKALERKKNLSAVVKVIQIVTARMPPLTKKNLMCKKTALVEQIERQLFSYTDVKTEMFKGVFKLFKFEIEHDGFYQGVFDFLLEQFLIMVLTGEWIPRWKDIPFPHQWKEPRPYGGKYTIIAAIQRNREKIIDLLGSEWQWLKGGKYEFNPANNTGKTDCKD